MKPKKFFPLVTILTVVFFAAANQSVKISPTISKIKFQVKENNITFFYKLNLLDKEQKYLKNYNSAHPESKAYLETFLSYDNGEVWDKISTENPEDITNTTKTASCGDWILSEEEILLKVIIYTGKKDNYGESNEISYHLKNPDFYEQQ